MTLFKFARAKLFNDSYVLELLKYDPVFKLLSVDLTHFSLETPKRVFGKQCRSRCLSESPLFAKGKAFVRTVGIA